MTTPTWHQSPGNPVELLDLANQKTPELTSWGYFAKDLEDTHTENMVWFDSFEALLQAIVQCEPKLYDLDEIECQKMIPALEKLADALTSKEIDLMQFVEQHNQMVEYMNLTWIGQYQELKSGDSDFACQMRAGFRDGEDASPIKDEENTRFIEALGTWRT